MNGMKETQKVNLETRKTTNHSKTINIKCCFLMEFKRDFDRELSLRATNEKTKAIAAYGMSRLVVNIYLLSKWLAVFVSF